MKLTGVATEYVNREGELEATGKHPKSMGTEAKTYECPWGEMLGGATAPHKDLGVCWPARCIPHTALAAFPELSVEARSACGFCSYAQPSPLCSTLLLCSVQFCHWPDPPASGQSQQSHSTPQSLQGHLLYLLGSQKFTRQLHPFPARNP